MTDPDNPAPDPLWDELRGIEEKNKQSVDEAYKTVEGYNAHLLNQVAGITDAEFVLVKKLSGDADDSEPGEKLVLPQKSALLYLRPDTRAQLHESGESVELAHDGGDPHTITGEIPERTKKLIADLLANTSAEQDEEHSTLDQEIWYGDVAGQRIKFVMYHGVMVSNGLDLQGRETKKDKPTLSVRVYRQESEDEPQVG